MIEWIGSPQPGKNSVDQRLGQVDQRQHTRGRATDQRNLGTCGDDHLCALCPEIPGGLGGPPLGTRQVRPALDRTDRRIEVLQLYTLGDLDHLDAEPGTGTLVETGQPRPPSTSVSSGTA